MSDPRGRNQRGYVPERKDAHTEVFGMCRIAGSGERFLGPRHCKERECLCIVDAEAETPTNP